MAERVEIIRCKDCLYCHIDYQYHECECKHPIMGNRAVGEYFYCGFAGPRKKEPRILVKTEFITMYDYSALGDISYLVEYRGADGVIDHQILFTAYEEAYNSAIEWIVNQSRR